MDGVLVSDALVHVCTVDERDYTFLILVVELQQGLDSVVHVPNHVVAGKPIGVRFDLIDFVLLKLVELSSVKVTTHLVEALADMQMDQ